MTIRTQICDMLGIEVPILLAGMGGVSYAGLCAAVSNAGGFGTLGMAGRSPDEIKGGTWEAFEREMQRAGYFAGGLRKIEAARAIAAHMVPSRIRSPSFVALRDALHDFEA